MPLENTPWAIDGPYLGSRLARRATYAGVGGAQGIVSKGDLRVNQLDVPGVGVKVASGVGLIENRYQTSPNETYVASNPTEHTIPSNQMPAANPSAKSYILAVVVGDPEFSQVGHPWMGSDDPAEGDVETFEYNRFTLIEVAPGATKLVVNYPALELARIDVPANTTTITNAMIHDLRFLASPRQSQAAFVSPGGAWTNGSPRYIPSGSSFADWGPQEYKPSIKVPEWATRAILIVNVNGARYKDTSSNVTGRIRTQLGAVTGPETRFDLEVEAGGGVRRLNLQTGGEYDVSGIAGTTVDLRVEGYQNGPGSPSNDQKLRLQAMSQMIFDVRFFEE